jgi:type IV pilus assembly protein PilB
MDQRPIGDIIKEVCGLADDQLHKAVEVHRETREPIADVLVSMGVINERDKCRCLGRQWGVPYVDLTETRPEDGVLDLVPGHLLQRCRAVPLAKSGKQLRLAMANPLDVYAIDQIRLVTGLDVEPLIATEEEIQQALSGASAEAEELGEALRRIHEDGSSDDLTIKEHVEEEEEFSLDRLKEMADDAPIVRLVNLIIRQAIRDKASDIHIQPEADRVRVRCRIDGILHDSMVVPKQAQASLISRIKVMADMDIAEKRAPQDGRITLVMNRREFDFRVSTYPAVNGEKVVMRILDKSGIQLGLKKLGMPATILEEFDALIQRSYGIVAVTGPTGSGKSTTLYSVLAKLNQAEKNILTIEDPVEYQLAGLTQAQVNERAGVTFASALRTMLRQDPNVILVGEMRDTETAIIAIEAALTGHLVFSTLHTNDAPGAVARLLEMGVEPFLIASSVIGVLAQRLVRVICPKCKEAYTPPLEAFRRLNLSTDSESVTFYRGKGCDACMGSGYKGRQGVFELMPVNDTVRDLILRRAPSHEIRQDALRSGMTTLRHDAMHKILEGITTMEEALRVIYTE